MEKASNPEKNLVFPEGSEVIYGMHGKCTVRAIESREVNGETLQFYKLEVVKSTLSRSNRKEPAIWLPVDRASKRGLRGLLSADEANDIVKTILSSREYYFSVNEPWSAVYTKIEQTLFAEGARGLAKAVSYLHVLKARLIVPTPDIAKFAEVAHKQLMRELSEALEILPRAADELITKALRHKNLPDS